MLWIIALALIIGGTLLIIYAMQNAWPIAPLGFNEGGRKPPGVKPPLPRMQGGG